MLPVELFLRRFTHSLELWCVRHGNIVVFARFTRAPTAIALALCRFSCGSACLLAVCLLVLALVRVANRPRIIRACTKDGFIAWQCTLGREQSIAARRV